ncbi:imm11 family protein [Bradyrhizobium commune]|uniref:DUF1629 domain-containing protein n=1 Tax=Bradyrhizobium commune TaxID=83627 RepID=A0A7S9D9Q7_9BRAD|nr:DUF1629 domain-containing protein [Bradyrhizobium commune]QPF93757.1 DUF1629 domain-containing protein [Bradyrhizobium commune]
MSDEKPKTIEKRSKAIKRRFYEMRLDFRIQSAPGVDWENIDELAPDTGELDPFLRRGFPNYPEAPRFVFDRKLGRAPLDFEQFSKYWLISDRMKAVFEAVDPAGFAFAACDVRLARGSYNGPSYWLCDIVRVLDAVDESRSRLEIGIVDDPKYRNFGLKYYSTLLVGGAKLVFKEDVVARAHIFRMAHLEATIICDQLLKDACKNAGVAGVSFRDASKL